MKALVKNRLNVYVHTFRHFPFQWADLYINKYIHPYNIAETKGGQLQNADYVNFFKHTTSHNRLLYCPIFVFIFFSSLFFFFFCIKTWPPNYINNLACSPPTMRCYAHAGFFLSLKFRFYKSTLRELLARRRQIDNTYTHSERSQVRRLKV